MKTEARLAAFDAAGHALADLGEGEITLTYRPTAHPGNRYGVLVHGSYGATYVASGPSPRVALIKALESRSDASVAA